MREQIWYELLNIKYGEFYLSKYISFHQQCRKYVNVITLIISLSGVLGWKFFEGYVWVALALISVLQLFLLIESQLIHSEKEIEQFLSLRSMYTKYSTKLEKLWYEFYRDQIKESDASKIFFEYKVTDWEPIEELDSKLNTRQFKFLEKISRREMDLYLKTYQNHG
jgi:hypothetical protein